MRPEGNVLKSPVMRQRGEWSVVGLESVFFVVQADHLEGARLGEDVDEGFFEPALVACVSD